MKEHSGLHHEVREKLDDEKQRFLVFRLCEEEYAIPLLQVKEVIAFVGVTPVPYTPKYFKGIMNLRGKLISVLDLRLKIQMSRSDVTNESAIIIVDLPAFSLGLIVDSIDSVLAVSDSDISPPPNTETSVRLDFITGVARRGSQLILLLAIEKILGSDDISLISKHGNSKIAA